MGLFGMFGGSGSASTNGNDSIFKIYDSISNGGNPNLLIWRSNVTDFNTNSVLTVNPGESALFIKNGQVVQEFEPGRYQLKSENYPFLSALRNLLSGGVTTYHCEIYFIRKAVSMEVLWGTSTPIQLRDPVQGIMTSLRAFGAYKITISDAAMFISRLSGHVQNFDQSSLDKYFSNEFQQKIKSAIAKNLKNTNEELLGVCARLDEFAEQITPSIQEVFNEYGLKLDVFSIASLEIPEDDPNRQLLEQSYAKKRQSQLYGEEYSKIRGFDVLDNALQNEGGAGGMMGMGVGLGAGMAAGGAMGELAKGLFNPQQQAPQQPTAPAAEDPLAKLAQLKKLLDAGLITQSDYDTAKTAVLAKLSS